jgi:protein-S-isoprenylcysteine O-methyltransferase Ste14
VRSSSGGCASNAQKAKADRNDGPDVDETRTGRSEARHLLAHGDMPVLDATAYTDQGEPTMNSNVAQPASHFGDKIESSSDFSANAQTKPATLLKTLVGAGDRIMALALPFIGVGVAANIAWPTVFRMGLGTGGLVAGLAFLLIGVPLWLISAVQLLVYVPRKALITTGPFRLMLHPVYTSVAILVCPGLGLALDTWLGPALGAVLYVSSRIFSGSEEKALATDFPTEYPAYRERVLLPWL